MTPTPDTPVANEEAPHTSVPTVVWVNDGLVCVEIVDAPPTPAGAGVCRCSACHGAMFADLAEKFYPDE